MAKELYGLVRMEFDGHMSQTLVSSDILNVSKDKTKLRKVMRDRVNYDYGGIRAQMMNGYCGEPTTTETDDYCKITYDVYGFREDCQSTIIYLIQAVKGI